MRTITGTIENVGGSPAANIEVKFTLVNQLSVPISTFVADTKEKIYGAFSVYTDTNGDFTISLWENDKLADESYYLVEVDLDTDTPFQAALLTGTGAIDWLDFLASGGTVNPAALDVMQDYLDRLAIVEEAVTIGTLLLNSGAEYPLKKMTRDGITSANPIAFSNILLSIRIVNARKDEYYQVSYQQNEAPYDGEATFDWIVSAFDVATYETKSSRTVLIAPTSSYGPQEQLVRDGTVQTISLYPPSRPEMRIDFTVDTSKLPSAGTIIYYETSALPGWSWIIDPSCYEYNTLIEDDISIEPISYSIATDGTTDIVHRSGDKLYKTVIKNNGYNELPNIYSISRADTTDRGNALFSTITSSTSDWLPPMRVYAVNNGDGHLQVFTGGNHGSNGDATGEQTARNILYKVLVDGQPISFSENTTGKAECLTYIIINELCGYNTTGAVDPVLYPKRYILKQSFVVNVRPGKIEVNAEVRAYEDIVVLTDYGPQLVIGGFNDTVLFLDGETTARVAFTSGVNSGDSLSYPNAWAVLLNDATNGQLVSYMDRNYEAGDGRYVDSNADNIFESGGKMYHSAVRSVSGISLSSGESYKWRGGYSIQAPLLQGTELDSFFTFMNDTSIKTVIVEDGHNYTLLP